MAGPLLTTKLHVPRNRALVARPRLTERLDRGAESALTLVCAPAGFGKTTLLAEWLAGGRTAAWVSLDPRDSDPAVFWTYVVAAVRSVAPGIGAAALDQPIETVLATLLNDLSAVTDDIVLVLDDYHLVDAPEIQDGMAFLLDHRPPQLHVVIAGRADPALSLARLRGRAELAEIRAADLRFRPDEAAAYLNEVMGLDLTAPDVAALESRTEGWIAALQLAALSMQGRGDIAGFIAGFAGDDRYIVDYLIEEVLQRQPEQVRGFLLRTSVLSRLTGPLCDAVTGQAGGQAELDALDRGNLFLVPLDDRRRWYRYHHLFGDVLRARLLDEQPGLVPELHRRAAEWWEGNGDRYEAIRHAMAGGDLDRAADLVELALPEAGRDRQEVTFRRWLEALPDPLIRARPVLSDGYAGSILVRGEVDGVETRLRDAERWLDATASATAPDRPPGMVVADEAQFRALPAAVAVHRAGQARILGDVEGTMAHARRALGLVGADDHLARGGAATLLGLAYWTRGDLDAAHRWYGEGRAGLEKAGHVSDLIGTAIALADIRIAQGRLGEAQAIYHQGLRQATERAGPPLRGAADMHVGLGEILRERDDLDGAARQLRSSEELGEHAGLPQNRYRRRVALARIRQAEGDLDAAAGLLAEAERLYTGDYSPEVRPVAALRTRLRIHQGAGADALVWARERGLSTADSLDYLREFEHLTLARALMARSAVDEAIGLLDRLLSAAEDGRRTGSVLEILVLQALSHQAKADLPAAQAFLERALTLAEPEGYVRLFLDEGAPMTTLLRTAAKRGSTSGYARRLLGARSHPAAPHRLLDPLSERELDVLRLLATDLGGPDIARRLVVSLNTLRTHTSHIYAKLGVTNRRAAVRRAAELNLLTRS
jgi:LuxR family transcriptional regulator, maltose regulon positive regulatory protein